MGPDDVQKLEDVDNKVEQETSHRLTWNECATFVVVVMGGSLALLVVLGKVFFAPPLLGLTVFVRLALLLAWLPTLIVCILLRPKGRARIALLLVVLGLLVSLFGLTLLTQSVLLSPLAATPAALPATCEKEPPTNSRVTYTCRRATLFFTEVYTFEGQEGLPFMILTDVRTIGS